MAADFGDAPNPYPTLLARDGARHEIGGPRIGALIDSEIDGQVSASATADDTTGVDDEDGVTFGPVKVGQLGALVTVNVQNAPTGAKLDAWIDFNGDGLWDSAVDQIAAGISVTQGSNVLTFDVPADISSGLKYARFRLSTAGGLAPGGAASDGEVEDHTVTINPPSPSRALFGHDHVIQARYNDVSTVAAGDIDGDGDIDLVSSSSPANSTDVAILASINDGAGNFTTRTLATGLGRTYKVHLADVDRDGDLDILSAHEGANGVAWHENQDGETFLTHKLTTPTSTYDNIETADVDGDGDVDLLVNDSSSFAWYENVGAQNFTTRLVDNQAFYVTALRAADIDHDGDIDFVVAKNFQPALSWYENDGTESFTKRLIVSTAGEQISDAQLGDIDKDGHIDILAGYYSGTSNPIRWYRNNGSGTFQQNTISVTLQPLSVELVDIDGDGDLDAAVSASWSSSGTVFSYANNGLGTFSESRVYQPGLSPESSKSAKQVVSADIDGDGDFDLVAAISDTNSNDIDGDSLLWFENANQLVSFGTAGPSSPQEVNGPAFTFTFTRAGDTSIPLTIEFAVEGTATYGSDYSQTGATTFDAQHGSITIPAGSSSKSITVSFQDDLQYELDETLRLRPLELPTYALDKNATTPQTWTIVDNEPGDFGDAPGPYPTLNAQNGPRHGASGPQLGSTRDAELDGQPSTEATGDDEPGDPSGGIEFGIVRPGQQNASVTVNVQNAPAGARVDAWLDFNQDGHWDNNGDRILTSELVQNGANLLTFDVPSSALSGPTYARFRISTIGGLGIVGESFDGEVEDVTLTLQPPVASSGRFAFASTIGGVSVSRLDTADLDRDGDLDLIWTSINYSLRGVYWSENIAGRFDTSEPKAIDPVGSNFSIGDIDNDGSVDVATDVDGRRTFVFYNDGLGQFTGVAVLSSDAPIEVSHALQLTDLDFDGDLDFIGSTTSGLAWVENLGGRQFAARRPGSSRGPAYGLPVDLDRDGDIDFVPVGNNFWMENTGGFVYSQRFFPTVGGATFVSRLVVDLDHDGNLDVVGHSTSGLRLAWLHNNGNRTFQGYLSDYLLDIQLTQIGSASLTVGDLDGDGNIDIVNTSPSDSNRGAYWYKNDGAGNFTQRFFSTDSSLYSLQAAHLADLDGDGDLDFVGTTSIIDGNRYVATWYRNVSTGVTIAVNPIAVPESSAQSLTYTFHRLDSVAKALNVNFVVAGDAAYGADYTATGAATFSASGGTVIFPVGVDTVQVTVLSLDDQLSESSESIVLSIAPGDDYAFAGEPAAIGTITDNEPGDFGDAPAPYPTTVSANGARHVAVGPTLGSLRDEEANGQPSAGAVEDSLVDSPDEEGVQFGIVRVGQASASAIVNVQGAPIGAYLDAWIDFNADGSWDAAFERIATRQLVQNGNNTITFDVPSTASSGQTYARFRLSSAGVSSPYGAAPDGEVEDYALTVSPPRATSATFAPKQLVASGASADELITADFDGDGDIDLAGIRESSTYFAWYENNGQGSFVRHVIDNAISGMGLTAADIDADGDMDLIAIAYVHYIRGFLNDGHGNFTPSPIIDYFVLTSPQDLLATDLDADGDMDLVIGTAGNMSQIQWFENRGVDGFVEHLIANRNDSIDSIDAVDLDRDGDLDLVLTGASWGYDDGVYWYENNGHAPFTYHPLLIGGSMRVAKTADLDNDGDTDILAAGFNGMSMYVNDGSANFVQRTIVDVDVNNVSIGDLDGDSDLDLVANLNFDTPTMRRYLNDGSGVFTGTNIDSGLWFRYRDPAIADFNNDGALDFVSVGTLNFYRNIAPLSGDFNRDRTVDGMDYILWRKAQGSTVAPFTAADANGDGIVGSADYNAWRANFGKTSPAPAAGAADLADVGAPAEEPASVPSNLQPLSPAVPAVAVDDKPAAAIESVGSTSNKFVPMPVAIRGANNQSESSQGHRLERLATLATSRSDEVSSDIALLTWLVERDSASHVPMSHDTSVEASSPKGPKNRKSSILSGVDSQQSTTGVGVATAVADWSRFERYY